MLNMKIAGAQMNPWILEKERNLEKCLDNTRIAKKAGAELVVFPECALTGYCFTSREESFTMAETVPGWSTCTIAALCQELETYVVVGLLEKARDKLYNTAAFLGPGGLIGKYRKNHLPYLGADRFTDHGNKAYQTYTTPIGNIGLNICFDLRFPEPSRIMALKGAEIIVLPTNWPEGAENSPEHYVSVRASENRVNCIAVNRVGSERGFKFIGCSKIVDPDGKTLVEASSNKEEIIYADVDLHAAKNKRVVIRPGEYELPLWDERRPELYGTIARR
jgi:predicted amidohydrolase